jgi:CBS domain-containing protein
LNWIGIQKMKKTKAKNHSSSSQATGLERLGWERTRAVDVMSTQLVVIHPEESYRDAVELLTEKRLTALPVVGKAGKLKGFLSEKDILRACESFEDDLEDFLDLPIDFVKEVETVQLDTDLDEVGRILAAKSYRHLPVVDSKGKLRGIISRRDLIRVIYLRLELAKVANGLNQGGSEFGKKSRKGAKKAGTT